MSFMDIFKTQEQQPAPQPAVAPVTEGNIPPQTTPATLEGNPTVPAEAAKNENPLDPYKELWQDKPTDPNAPAPAKPPAPLNAADLAKTFGKVDFSSGITAEQHAAIAGGGEGASTAMAEIVNASIQQAMVQSTLINNQLTEQAVAKAVADQAATIPDLVRSQAIANHSAETNPLFKNPAIKPIADATRERLIGKFPDAPPAEITKMTQDFIIAMGAEFAPKETLNDNGAGDTDWAMFLES